MQRNSSPLALFYFLLLLLLLLLRLLLLSIPFLQPLHLQFTHLPVLLKKVLDSILRNNRRHLEFVAVRSTHQDWECFRGFGV
jgi:hypothetical protein